LNTAKGIENVNRYESIDEAEFQLWYDELAVQHHDHPLLAEIRMLMQRHMHLQRFADKLTRLSDRQHRKVIEANQKLAEKTITDPLTSLLNRRGMYLHLETAARELAIDGTPFGLLLADLDHFKRVNDHHGHQAGDDTLVKVSAAMSSVLRKENDLIARWGGEEFLALVAVRDVDNLLQVANKLLLAVRATEIETSQGVVKPTVSIGACFCNQSEPIDPCIDRADVAMYHAKNSGRNQAVLFENVPSERHA